MARAILLLLLLVPLQDKTDPVMEIVSPRQEAMKGVVVAAPHVGYDLHTGDIAKALGRRLPCRVVIAKNYREPKEDRWHNVNRPTNKDEKVDRASKKVFEDWVKIVRRAHGTPVPVYVEIHGNKRNVTIKGKKVPLDVIEVATVGISEKEAMDLLQAWEGFQAKSPTLPQIAFDVLGEKYKFKGQKIKFYFKAGGAKKNGILQDQYVKRALHMELPVSAREPKVRGKLEEGLVNLIKQVKR